MTPADIKEKLYNHCCEYLNSHIETNRYAIEEARQSAMSETKTVASEEPETGKERSQREMETLGRRLDEVIEQQEQLQSIDYKKTFTAAEPGALVETTVGIFYISLSADEIEIDGVEYCPVSLASPIGQSIAHKKAGESASFRGKTIKILGVC